MGRIPTAKIYDILSSLNGTAALYIEDCSTGEKLEINPNMYFPACSVIKIPMFALLLKDAEDGRVDLDEPHEISPENRVTGTGILCDLNPSLKPTLRDLGKLMIIMSDNIATNEVMDIIGVERFHAFCNREGCPNFIWQRKMMDFEAIKKGLNNYLQAGETGQVVARIAKENFVNKEISKTIFETMCSQKYRNKLPSLLPAVQSYSGITDHVPESMVLCANKTGDLVGIQHDVGIFVLPDGRRYVIAMFTKDLTNDIDGIEAIAKVSLEVYKAMC